MLSLLPDYADPLRLCALGKAYEGRVPLAELPRLVPLLTSSVGEAAFTLAFDMDADRRPVVRVRVQAHLPVQCQRCLGPMDLEVDADARLVVVSGPDEAERLPDDVDPLLLEDAKIALRSLIEDELILAIPPAPTHVPEACAVKVEAASGRADEVLETAEAPADHPFAALAGWKSDRSESD